MSCLLYFMVYLCMIYWFVCVQLVYPCTTVPSGQAEQNLAWGVVIQGMPPEIFSKIPHSETCFLFGYCFAKRLLKFITTSL